MSLTRRRFITISAAFAAFPVHAGAAHRWQGQAFGAEVDIALHGPRRWARDLLAKARAEITACETAFNLYDLNSELSRLNKTSELLAASPRFQDLWAAVEDAHILTNGRFDPSIQTQWQQLAKGLAPVATPLWPSATKLGDRIALAPKQSLTFNGIAQGFATDQVADLFRTAGAERALINIGEHVGIGGPWRLGLSDPALGHLGARSLENGALATSSPAATPLAKTGHILMPGNVLSDPLWSTVSVEAQRATLADALSTALVHAPRTDVAKIAQMPKIHRITLVDFDGNLETL